MFEGQDTLTDNLVPRVFHFPTPTSLTPFRMGRWRTLGTRLAKESLIFTHIRRKKKTERMDLDRVWDVMVDENAKICQAHPSSI